MGQTVYGVNHPQAVRHWAGALFASTMRESFLYRNMMEQASMIEEAGDQMANAPVVVINDLTKNQGDRVSFDIYIQLTGRPTFGDDILENNLEDLSSFTDEIRINQLRHGVDAGGVMSQKRVLQNLRKTAKGKLQQYFSQYFDQAGITTLSGGRGVSPQLLIPMGASAAIKDGSPYDSYDSGHIRYGGDAVSKATLEAADLMSLSVLNKLLTYTKSNGGGADGVVGITPLDKGGEDDYKLIMSPHQEHSLRTNTNTGDWMDIQKAAAGANGYGNNLFKNTLGVYRGIHMREYQHVVQFDDYGASQNLDAHRAVFMGRQALAVAFGSASSKNLRADWVEEKKDYGNRTTIAGGMMYSFKLPKFDGKVVNSFAIDTSIPTDI